MHTHTHTGWRNFDACEILLFVFLQYNDNNKNKVFLLSQVIEEERIFFFFEEVAEDWEIFDETRGLLKKPVPSYLFP